MKNRYLLIAAFLLFIGAILFHFSTHIVVLKFLFPEKIWVHRVNSIVKLKEVSGEFEGVELDVVWEDDQFDVNHPPANSIGLSLSRYFSSIDIKEHKFWIDFKNLDEKNYQYAFSRLDSITAVNNIKRENIIIESGNPQYLYLFEKHDYLTSFYLPSGFSNSNIEERDILKNRIDDHVKKFPTSFLSTFLGEYIYLKSHCPDKQMILWHTGNLKSIKNKKRIYEALLDKNVKVILLPVNSNLGDR